MKINEAILAAQKLKSEADFLMHEVGYDGYDCDKIEQDNMSIEDRLLLSELEKSLHGLEQFVAVIDYISLPIKAEGTLLKNANGRYEFEAREYTSGCRIEYLVYDDFEGREDWHLSRVEHNGDDYYIVANNGLSLDGLRVRIR